MARSLPTPARILISQTIGSFGRFTPSARTAPARRRATETTNEFRASPPVWSPDGTKLAFSAWKPEGTNFYRNGRLFVHDLATGNRVRMETRGPNTDVFSWVDPCGAPAPGAATRPPGELESADALANAAAASGYKVHQGDRRQCHDRRTRHEHGRRILRHR